MCIYGQRRFHWSEMEQNMLVILEISSNVEIGHWLTSMWQFVVFISGWQNADNVSFYGVICAWYHPSASECAIVSQNLTSVKSVYLVFGMDSARWSSSFTFATKRLYEFQTEKSNGYTGRMITALGRAHGERWSFTDVGAPIEANGTYNAGRSLIFRPMAKWDMVKLWQFAVDISGWQKSDNVTAYGVICRKFHPLASECTIAGP